MKSTEKIATDIARDTLRQLSLGRPRKWKNVMMVPILGREAEVTHVSLADGLSSGSVQVTELHPTPQVNSLQVTNENPRQVLLVSGEELVGARQDRMIASTVLVGGNRSVQVPVACVERDRWRGPSPFFEVSGALQFLRARARACRDMGHLANGRRATKQVDRWNDIDEAFETIGRHTATRALRHVYGARPSWVDDFAMKWAPAPRQAGAVYLTGGRIALDLFESPRVYARYAVGLARAAAFDAWLDLLREGLPDGDECAPRSGEVTLWEFLTKLLSSDIQCFPGVAEGIELGMRSDRAVLGGLVMDDRVLHLSAFHLAVDDRAPRLRIRAQPATRVLRAGVVPDAAAAREAARIASLLDQLAGARHPIGVALETAPEEPGLYALYGDAEAWRALTGKASDAERGVPLWLGWSTENLRLTLASAGGTRIDRRSMANCTLAAYLAPELEPRPCGQNGEACRADSLSEWMSQHLTVAWTSPAWTNSLSAWCAVARQLHAPLNAWWLQAENRSAMLQAIEWEIAHRDGHPDEGDGSPRRAELAAMMLARAAALVRLRAERGGSDTSFDSNPSVGLKGSSND